MPPNPPSNAHGFAMRSMSLRDMQIPKSEKKFLGPPPTKSWDAPDDTDDDNEVHLVKHSAYYGENEFSKLLSSKAGMSILSGNIQNINAKFDEFSSFVDRVYTHYPISAILLQECWIDDNAIDSLALFNLKDYNMVYQSSTCLHSLYRTNMASTWRYTLVCLDGVMDISTTD